MKQLLNRLYQHETLSKAEASAALTDIASGQYNNSQIASFLTVFIMRGIQLEELEGFREAMLSLCVSIDLSEYDPMDLCGTGGDGKDTFNISTTSSFVAAAAGVKVAKHGNYGVSSISGSSNMIESFGYTFTNDADELKRKMDKAGICFLHAPLFHPAMKHVAPTRRELGVRTFFNMLGPLVNPASVKKQLVGTFNLELSRLYGYLLQKAGTSYNIVHATDGYDEVSLTGTTKVISDKGEQMIDASYFGLSQLDPKDIKGGDTIAESAKIFETVLKGQGSDAQNSVVIANSSLAIQTFFPEKSIREAVDLAKETLLAGKGWDTFKRFLEA